MKKFFASLCGAAVLSLSAGPVASKPISEIESYGIYAVTSDGFTKLTPYSRDYSFVDFNFLNEIPFVFREDDSLKLVVYEKNFEPTAIELALRPIKTAVDIRKLRFSVKPTGKPDMYEVSVDTPVSDGAMLQVRSWFFDTFGVIMLGDTQSELVKYFSQKDLPNAPVVVQYLEDALVAFPNNPELKALGDYWKQAAGAEKDRQAYSYVEEKWRQYEQAEKLTLKQRYLEALIVEINGYLNAHPDGYKAAEAVQRKTMAEEKLKEYEKLL